MMKQKGLSILAVLLMLGILGVCGRKADKNSLLINQAKMYEAYHDLLINLHDNEELWERPKDNSPEWIDIEENQFAVYDVYINEAGNVCDIRNEAAMDDIDYQERMRAFMGDAEELEIPFVNLTTKNIEKIKFLRDETMSRAMEDMRNFTKNASTNFFPFDYEYVIMIL